MAGFYSKNNINLQGIYEVLSKTIILIAKEVPAMLGISPEKICNTFVTMAKTHRGEMEALCLEWKKDKIYHPRYEEKFDIYLPYVVIEWK